MDFSQDFDPHWTRNTVIFNHDKGIPNNFRCIVVGSSGSGKTYRVFNMLLRPGYLDYDTLHIFSPTLYQDEYKLLIAGFRNKLNKEDIIQCFLNQDKVSSDPEVVAREYAKIMKEEEKWHDIKVYTYATSATGDISQEAPSSVALNTSSVAPNTNTSASRNMNTRPLKLLPQPDELEKGRKHLIVFDDCMTGSQKQIENYFIRGRHNNCNVIYITQNWFELPNRTIRGNSNLILLFPSIPQDRLKKFYNEVVSPLCSTGFSQISFVNYCYEKWNENYNYVTINKEKKIVQ